MYQTVLRCLFVWASFHVNWATRNIWFHSCCLFFTTYGNSSFTQLEAIKIVTNLFYIYSHIILYMLTLLFRINVVRVIYALLFIGICLYFIIKAQYILFINTIHLKTQGFFMEKKNKLTPNRICRVSCILM